MVISSLIFNQRRSLPWGRLFSLVALFLPFALLGQNKQLEFEATLPDSVKYYVPEFTAGSIVFTDGGFSTGKLNISVVDQTVRFVDKSGEILSLSNQDQVDRVVIGKYLFLKNGNEFAAVVRSADEASLVVTRRFVFERDKKKGAFGARSETTSISSIASASAESGMQFNLSTTSEYRIDTVPFLYRKKRFYPVTRKNLLKFFPEKKDAVSAYLDSHNVNLQRVEEVELLFQEVL